MFWYLWFIDYCFGEPEACLFLGDTKLSLADAKIFCSDNDGSLIQWETEQEFNFILDFARGLKSLNEGYGWKIEFFWTDMHYENVIIYYNI